MNNRDVLPGGRRLCPAVWGLRDLGLLVSEVPVMSSAGHKGAVLTAGSLVLGVEEGLALCSRGLAICVSAFQMQ